MGKIGEIKIVVLNSHGVGQVCYIKRLPRRGETLAATHWKVEEDGGKGATVSVALGRLGIPTGYIGKVGYDPWGDMGDNWMTAAGVDTTYMYRDSSVSTGTGLIMIDEDGQNTIVDGDSACEALTHQEIKNALEAMKEAKVFITGFGMPWCKALDGAAMAKRDYQMLTICNVSPLPDAPLGCIDYLDFIILNDVEAKALLGLQEDSTEPYPEIARKLRVAHGCGGVIITCGEQGSIILDGETLYEIAATPVIAAETIGAGDGYLAAFAAGLVEGKTVPDAAKFASCYAAFKVTRRGTMTTEPNMGYPMRSEVDAFIAGLSDGTTSCSACTTTPA